MGPSAKNFTESDDEDARHRVKRRLYLLIQTAVWGGLFLPGFAALIFNFGNLKPDSYLRLHPARAFFVQLLPFAGGFLLTHFTRRVVKKWQLKGFSPMPLMARIFGMSLLLALAETSGFFLGQSWLIPGTAKLYKGFLLIWLLCSLLFIAWFVAYLLFYVLERFNRAENDGLRLAARTQEAELHALRSQVNPHFIFNSLNSLRALIEEDPARARLAVTQLANLLRYSLQSSQHDSVPFEEELRMAKEYLALEQVRYEERLRVLIDVAPDTLVFRVPPMLLQTLVENAVKYGVARQECGGQVSITARVAEGRLHLLVTNPGTLGENGHEAESSTGVGLRNATDRLRLLFGPKGELWLRTGGPNLVVAEALVPGELASSAL